MRHKNNNYHRFTVQWNLVKECEYTCNHCYLKHFNINKRINSDEIVEQIIRTKKYFQEVQINLTGGNPFFHPDIKNIIRKLYNAGIQVSILGNPIKSKQFNLLKEVSKYINEYQLSLDGIDRGHKLMRGVNNINEIKNSADKIIKLGISINIMFTLNNNNKEELIESIDIVKKRELYNFSFSRLVPSSHDQKSNIIEAVEYRKLLEKVFNYLRENDIYNFSFKDNLWKLYLYEQGLYEPKENTYSGCSIGIASISIMPDGSVYPCSRIPIKIGNLENDSITDIFFNNTLLKKFRDVNSFEKCRDCILRNVCRGCPAITYALIGDCFKSDPQCWKIN